MAITPGQTSGTYNFFGTNGSLTLEAFDRCGITPEKISRHMLISARTSINLQFIEFENQGFNAWELDTGTIDLTVNQAVYTLPANLVMLTDVFYSNVNGDGSGVNLDRIMVPTTRTAYAALTNKLQQGIPTQYWFQMLQVPQVTIWEVPAVGAPNYVLNWYGLMQMQDANLGSGEVPNVPRRALDCLCAGLAKRLAQKFAPALYQQRKADFDEAWAALTRRDQEPGPISYLPQVGLYGRMR